MQNIFFKFIPLSKRAEYKARQIAQEQVRLCDKLASIQNQFTDYSYKLTGEVSPNVVTETRTSFA